MKHTVPAFDDESVDIEWPKFDKCDNDIFVFAQAMEQTAIIAAKRQQSVTKKNVALKYLKVIIEEGTQAHSLQARMLRTALKPLEPPLPRRFDLKQMVHEIRDSQPNEKEDIDLASRKPSIYKADVTTRGTSMDLRDNGITRSVPPPAPTHLQGYEYETFVVNQTTYRPHKNGRRQQRRLQQPVPDPKQVATKGPSLYDATITCEACGLQGHPAIHCFGLAAGVLIDRFLAANKSNDTVVQQAVDFWMQRNAPLICDNQTNEQLTSNLLKIMKTYTAAMKVTTDEIKDEMDWHYFDQGEQASTVQEVFGISGWQDNSMEHGESK